MLDICFKFGNFIRQWKLYIFNGFFFEIVKLVIFFMLKYILWDHLKYLLVQWGYCIISKYTSLYFFCNLICLCMFYQVLSLHDMRMNDVQLSIYSNTYELFWYMLHHSKHIALICITSSFSIMFMDHYTRNFYYNLSNLLELCFIEFLLKFHKIFYWIVA